MADGNEASLRARVLAHPWAMGLAAVVLGPVVEELLYRFVLFRSLLRAGSVVAHVVTAVAFGLQHVAVAVLVQGERAQWWNLPSYALFSLIQTTLYVRSRTLLVPIGVHMLTNGLGVALMLA